MHPPEAEGQKPVSGIMQIVNMQKGMVAKDIMHLEHTIPISENCILSYIYLHSFPSVVEVDQYYAPINVKPQGGVATHRKLTERAFPQVGNLTWPPSWKT